MKVEKNAKVDSFLVRQKRWRDEIRLLREIILSTGLKEELKWGQPCYTFNGKNVVLIHGFKEYFAILFMKGALLNNSDNLLVQQTENVQLARQIRFKNIDEVTALEPKILNYINNAIEVEKSGKTFQKKSTEDYEVVGEFSEKLEELPELKEAFNKLTPGRQRAYLFYFSSAKLSKTRQERVDKNIDRILDGLGLND